MRWSGILLDNLNNPLADRPIIKVLHLQPTNPIIALKDTLHLLFIRSVPLKLVYYLNDIPFYCKRYLLFLSELYPLEVVEEFLSLDVGFLLEYLEQSIGEDRGELVLHLLQSEGVLLEFGVYHLFHGSYFLEEILIDVRWVVDWNDLLGVDDVLTASWDKQIEQLDVRPLIELQKLFDFYGVYHFLEDEFGFPALEVEFIDSL